MRDRLPFNWASSRAGEQPSAGPTASAESPAPKAQSRERTKAKRASQRRSRRSQIGKPKRPPVGYCGRRGHGRRSSIEACERALPSQRAARRQTDKLSSTWPGNLALVFISAVVVVPAGGRPAGLLAQSWPARNPDPSAGRMAARSHFLGVDLADRPLRAGEPPQAH